MDNSLYLGPVPDNHEEKTIREKMAEMQRKRNMSSDAIDKAAKEFEQVFVSQMLGHMMKPTELPKPFSGGHAEKMYHSLLVDEYGKAIVDAGGMGIADHIKRQLMQLQEVQ